MKLLKKANLVLLVLLSLSSGMAKVLLMPQEVKFFGGAGFGETATVMFGLAQVIGGVLLSFKKVRVFGAVIVAITFVVATVLVFMDGKIAFGLFSMLPVVMLGIVVHESTMRSTKHA